MDLKVNQVMKVVIDNSIIPQLTKELEFYKRAYDNAHDVIQDNSDRINRYTCSECFVYTGFCHICENIVCKDCKNTYVVKCINCSNNICNLCRIVDELCGECSDSS